MIDDLIKFDESQNIAADFDLDLVKIGSDIVDGYDADLRSREGWDGEMKEAMDLTLQVMETKTFPWRGASNVKMPLLTEAAIQFNSMMYPALIQPTDLVKARVIGKDVDGQKAEQAIRVSKHMSYQILEEMEEWEEEMDIGLMILPILGNMYKKSYYSGEKARNVSEMLSPANFVVNYNTKSLDDAYRKTHVMDMTANDIRKKVLSGEYLDEDLGTPKVEDKKKEGETPPQADSGTPFKILECHTYLDLDKDDLEEPYIVTVDHDSKKVLRIVSGFDLDQVLVNDKDEIFDVPQLQYFTKYGFIPNPDGAFLDLGLGKLLSPINHTVNSIINMMIDAGTKSITGGGFLGRGARIKGGSLKFKMGEYKRIDSTGDDIRKNLITMPNPDIPAVLFSLLNLLITTSHRLASTLDSQVGENPGQNQKATTSQIVEQNGMKIFNGIYKRCHRGLKKEIKKLFYLNSIYLPAESYLNVLDEKIDPQQAESILKADYNVQSVNIVPAADSKYTSEQVKMAKARALTEKIALGHVNPEVATRRALQAEEQTGLDEIMAMPPKQPSFEETKFQQEMQYKWAELKLNTMSEEQKWIQGEILTNSQSMLNLAKAESAEAGIQYEKYSQQLTILREMSKNNIENMKRVEEMTKIRQRQQQGNGQKPPQRPPQQGQRPMSPQEQIFLRQQVARDAT